QLSAHIDATIAAMNAWKEQVVVEGVRLAQDPITRFRALQLVGPDGVADSLIEPIEQNLTTLFELGQAKSVEATKMRDAARASTKTVLYIGVAGAIIIAIALGFLLSRMIARPIGALTSAMGRLASGDNSVEVPAVSREDEIGEM